MGVSIHHLRVLAHELPCANFFVEFLIPRMGRRADMIVLKGGIIFVVEYKLGARLFDRSSLDQVYGYGLDLKHFHETSHHLPIAPILVATEAPECAKPEPEWDYDGLAQPIGVNTKALGPTIKQIASRWGSQAIEASDWVAGRYRPTPTIVEAAQALYRGHDVEEISRSEAGVRTLHAQLTLRAQAIENAKRERPEGSALLLASRDPGKRSPV